jgi:Mn-dependent DtxR family transcriptional regulator
MIVHNNKRILDFLKEKKVITSSELAGFLKISWNTADKWLLELALENKVERIKKEKVNLWMVK